MEDPNANSASQLTLNGTNANGNGAAPGAEKRKLSQSGGLDGIPEKTNGVANGTEKIPRSDATQPPTNAGTELEGPERVIVAGKGQSPGDIMPELKPKVNRKLKFVVEPMAISAALLVITLWASTLWIFGCNHNAQHRAHKLKFRVRDFDGGIVGQTLISTLESMRSNEMPGWEITNGTITDVVQSVWNAHYWGAIVVQPGASARLQEALANPTAAANYDPSSAMKNYLTGARYFTTYSSYIRPGFTEALAATTAQLSGYAAAQALSANAGATVGTAGMQALAKIIAQPVASTEVDMAPLPFQPRVFLNTFGVVVPNLAGFFFNMIIMGVFMEAGVYSHPTTMWKLVRAKFIIKIIWCVLASLVVTSVNFSFRESYTYPAKNFFALWTNMLFYCWLNYNIFGGLIAWLHVKYMMFFVFPIVVTSVAAAVFPPEVGDTFYDISYMFPSHAYWMIAITIFGRGCCNRLRLYAPIVMVWVIVTELFWLTGDWRYSRNSRKGAGVPKAEPDGDNAVTQIVFPQEQEENEPDPYPLARSISTTVRRMSRSSQAGPPGAAAPAKRASVSR